MQVAYLGVLVFHLVGAGVQFVGAHYLVGVIDVQFEVRHHGHVVPQLVLEVVHVAQVREEVAHDVHDGFDAAGALGAVLDGEGVVHHLLDVAAVFRHDEFAFLC